MVHTMDEEKTSIVENCQKKLSAQYYGVTLILKPKNLDTILLQV